MGDFNDTPDSRILTEFSRDMELCALSVDPAAEGSGSIKYKGVWGFIDHFFLSENLFKRIARWENGTLMRIYSPAFLLEDDREFLGQKPRRTFIGPRYNGGVRDHLPILLRLQRKSYICTMKQYLDLLEHIMRNGTDKSDRTGTGTRSIFGYQMRFDLNQGFPALTTKKLHLRSIIYELLWFIAGDTNIRYLNENGVTIWDEWADDNGDLGPIYGHQWRSWPTTDGAIDQLTALVESLKSNPDSRRHIVSAWNVAEVKKMALPPCHALFQFYVAGGKLSCQLYQRSADVFLGVPFNIASYALLTMMLAQVCGYLPESLSILLAMPIFTTTILSRVALQLTREPRSLPKMLINPDKKDLFSFEYEDFTLEGYDPYPE